MKYTPMIEQYLKIKKNYQDAFLFYRLGDFYEMFFEDAINASKILEITLTGREAGAPERIPMCGVPFHSAENYIDILVNQGHKVAICEQTTPASQGKIVERKVVRVVTPGTYMNYKNLNENNYLGAVYFNDDKYYLTFCDIMTAETRATILDNFNELQDEVDKNNIKEIININVSNLSLRDTYITNFDFDNHTTYQKTETINNENIKISANHLLKYIENTQNTKIDSLKDFEIYFKNKFVYMTNYSIKNLELTQNMTNGSKKGSLLSVIDKTKTAAGSRKLKKWLENPLLNQSAIEFRQNIISDFKEEYFFRLDLHNLLREVYDIERISTKLSYNIVSPKELNHLKKTLNKIPEIKHILSSINKKSIIEINHQIDSLENLTKFLNEAIDDNAEQTIKEGNVIKKGFNETLDKYKNAKNNANQMLLDIEQREKERTGIKNLKIGYNKVFGYYIEISKANNKNFDFNQYGYERKQTLSNCERYVSLELKEIEDYILNSNSKIEELELKIFQEVKEAVTQYVVDLQNLADKLSDLDVFINLANISEEYGYTRPMFNDKNMITIEDGRHPIVERMVDFDTYISNDCHFNHDENILLITGPNMSGKSTYMRQLALIVILAQIGSDVPCTFATLPIFDKIFTRIGASDDLAGGKSTFMVEMMEAKNAIVESTKNSLLIFDEIGRGTSTYDGIALAQSIIEYINKNIGCKTLFSTHYHELTKLEENHKGIKNIHVSAKEDKGNLIFLYKVKTGAIEKSYGIHVAKLAKLPDNIIFRANDILTSLENYSNEYRSDIKEMKQYEKISFDLDDIEENYNSIKLLLDGVDIFNTTPIQAMQILNDLKNKLK